jgi:hypothetical protein
MTVRKDGGMTVHIHATCGVGVHTHAGVHIRAGVHRHYIHMLECIDMPGRLPRRRTPSAELVRHAKQSSLCGTWTR